jgi:hypothetical protein
MNFPRVLVSLVVLLMVGLSWLQPLDQLAEEHAEAGLKRSLAAFAAARALNAVVSVVQGTEITGGALVNVTVALGQVLDPVNDLVEQFSKLMLVVSVVFSAQLLLMKMGAGWVLSALLSALALVWLACLWRQTRHPALPVLSRFLFALLLVRFLVPVSAIASEVAYNQFMSNQYVVSHNALVSQTEQLNQLGGPDSPPGAANKPRWWEVRELISLKLDELKLAADRVVGHVIDLIVVFVMQTVVLPLLVLLTAWLGWRSVWWSSR